MKRTDITAILLGVLAFAFFLPVAILLAGLIVLIVGRAGSGGISAVARGLDFNFVFGLRSRTLLIVFIVVLAAVASWIGRRISSHRHRT